MAQYTGWFPYQPVATGGPYYRYSKNGDHWVGLGSIPNGQPIAGAPYASEIQAAISNKSNMSTSGFNPWHFGPFSVTVKGIPSPVPLDVVLEGPVVKVNNTPYLKRSKRGEMVVSDYKRFQALLTFANGGEVLTKGEIAWFGRDCRSLTSLGFVVEPKASWNAVRKNSNQAVSGSFQSQYQYQTISDAITAYDVGWDNEIIQGFLDGLSVPGDPASTVVTDTLSEANVATVDILTAMAEMPETMKDALKGCMSVLRIFKQAKKREFSLLTKEKRIRYEHEQKVFRSEFKYRHEHLAARNDRTRRIVEKKRVREIAQLRADLRKSLLALTDAIASVWLTFRYSIMPNVYLIEGIVKSFDKINDRFERWRSLEHATIPLPEVAGWSRSSDTIDAEVRCMIKRKFNVTSDLLGLLRQYSVNAFLTAWELIPLSFVIDWFINIGNMLSSVLGNNQVDYTQAATLSLKIPDKTVTYTHESGASVNVRFKGYQRIVIDPRDYCRFEFAPDVSGDRVYDSLALSWNIAVSKLFK